MCELFCLPRDKDIKSLYYNKAASWFNSMIFETHFETLRLMTSSETPRGRRKRERDSCPTTCTSTRNCSTLFTTSVPCSSKCPTWPLTLSISEERWWRHHYDIIHDVIEYLYDIIPYVIPNVKILLEFFVTSCHDILMRCHRTIFWFYF